MTENARRDGLTRTRPQGTLGHGVQPLAIDSSVPEPRAPGWLAYAVVAVWATVTSIAISLGAFEARLPALPDLPVGAVGAVGIPLAAFVIAYNASRRFRSFVLAFDLRLVANIQLFRVVGAAFLFALAFGELPSGFAQPAFWGDIATGIAAFYIVISLYNGTLTRRRFLGFTALGLGDFVVAIGMGIATQPVAIDTWPMAFFPGLAVPFFAAVHFIGIAQMRHGFDGRVAMYGGRPVTGGPTLPRQLRFG